MNKERIVANINELHDKIKILDELLFSEEEEATSLDLDTQLMYMRLMYDSYISLRPFVRQVEKSSRKGRGKKDSVAEPVVEEVSEEEDTATLPLLFAEDEETAPVAESAPVAETAPATEEPLPEAAQAEIPVEEQEPEENVETATPSVDEEPVVKAVEEVAAVETETAEQKPAAEEAAPSEVPETADQEEAVDLDLVNKNIPEIDIDAIEFEEEDEAEEDETKPEPRRSSEESYSNYYPGLNPRAMNGELEDHMPLYSDKGGSTLGEHFTHQFPSLNDQLSQKKGEFSLGERMQKEQISDLTRSIDLSLKFIFIKELFKGDATLLSKELERLNNCRSLDESLSYFESMKQQYHWKEGTEAVDKLYELVLRKYAR